MALESYLLEILTLAASAENRSRMSSILESVAKRYKADGAIIWRESPNCVLDCEPPRGSLFVFADWIMGPKKCHLHNLPWQSATGEAVLRELPDLIVDTSDPHVFKGDGFIVRAEIKTFSMHPFRFSDGKWGCLNLYYREQYSPAAEGAMADLVVIARFISRLDQIIRTNAAHALTLAIGKLLGESQYLEPKERLSQWDSLCHLVSESLQALEVSLFLTDQPSLANPKFDLAGTVWPFPISKVSYTAEKVEGLTAWPLVERKSINIFDLATLADQPSDSEFPGAKWNDSLQIRESASKLLSIKSDDDLPPLTFIAVPVLQGDLLLGVLRCCVAKGSPYFFGEFETELLELVAKQVAGVRISILAQVELSKENAAWKYLVSKIGELNDFAGRELQKDQIDSGAISQRCVAVTSDVIGEPALTLLFDNVGESDDIAVSCAIDNGMTRALGNYPFLIRQIQRYAREAVQKCMPMTRYYEESSGIRKRDRIYPLVIAPIISGGQATGAIVVSGNGSPRVELVTRLMGQQLGLYRRLLATIVTVNRQRREFTQAFEDFNHQLRTPVLALHGRVLNCFDSVLQSQGVSEENKKELRAIRGLASKCKAASGTLRLFTMLARNEPIPLALRQLTGDDFVKILVQVAMDAEDILGAGLNVHLRVDRHIKLTDRDWLSLFIDRDLLIQAMFNLADNAIKYSYPGTVAHITAGISKSGRFRISVESTGIQLSGQDIEKARGRDWRSEDAEAVTGEGSGIGLWVVDNIMKSHGGDLVIHATNQNSETIFDLLFPFDRRR